MGCYYKLDIPKNSFLIPFHQSLGKLLPKHLSAKSVRSLYLFHSSKKQLECLGNPSALFPSPMRMSHGDGFRLFCNGNAEVNTFADSAIASSNVVFPFPFSPKTIVTFLLASKRMLISSTSLILWSVICCILMPNLSYFLQRNRFILRKAKFGR